MIIVNQDKAQILNFNNLIAMWVEDVNDVDNLR